MIVTNIDTNTSTMLTTNGTGYYEANLLLAGNYRVSAQMAGFKKSIRSGIELSVGARAEIDITLESVSPMGSIPRQCCAAAMKSTATL